MAYTNINKSSDYFNTKLYTGTGANQSITGVGFQPDWVWIKSRGLARSNQINDAVRGAGKILATDNTGAEFTDTNRITTLDSDGFTLGSNDNVNGSSDNLVSWNWRANGQGSANTDGTINTTYTSANTTSGMSIIQYNGNGSAGATIGHGLGVAPKCVIIKRTDTTSNWIFGTGARGFDKFLYFNTADAETTNAGAFNNTAPSSSVITLGSWNDVNNASGTYIAYAFAEKKGFSKFGSYEGNTNTDGIFIYTGFKPAFVMIKSYNTASRNWTIQDNKRSSVGGPNPNDKWLYSNSSEVESNQASNPMDFLSNGFKLRNTGSYQNQNAYIYMAIAEAPLVGSNNVPCTAR